MNQAVERVNRYTAGWVHCILYRHTRWAKKQIVKLGLGWAFLELKCRGQVKKLGEWPTLAICE